MTRLALVADLHFGSVPEGLAEALRAELLAAAPDACLVAGDLTLRARRREFRAARRWLDQLPFPRLVVPGNHDLAAKNLMERFFRPYRRFQRVVRPEEQRTLRLPDCVVAGLNTVAPWQPHLRWAEGRVRRKDAAALAVELAGAPAGRLKIVLAHHPFAPVPDMARARPVRRAPTALSLFRAQGVDLILSGHTHQSYVLPLGHAGAPMLAVGAPTALSWRTRGEANGYWLIEITPEQLVLRLRLRAGERFADGACRVHRIEAGRLQLPATVVSEAGVAAGAAGPAAGEQALAAARAAAAQAAEDAAADAREGVE